MYVSVFVTFPVLLVMSDLGVGRNDWDTLKRLLSFRLKQVWKKIPTRVKGKLLIDGTEANCQRLEMAGTGGHPNLLSVSDNSVCQQQQQAQSIRERERLPYRSMFSPLFKSWLCLSFFNSYSFRYMGHPNGKVARASHLVFVAFVVSGKDSNMDDRVLLKEQLVYYYMQRALEGYPGITPFEGMASGVASLVRHIPTGRPATLYCINSIVEKANILCSRSMEEDADMWKNWQGDSEPCKKLVELLLRLLSLVDIQVLPNLMKLLAQFTLQLPKDGQNMVLDEIHTLVAESDDITKPTLVSWVQSLSFLCS
ncbi:hypothetical protein IFM89_024059 [Coptis chinensis]|uniref:Uncharacterized protein n=1 Tax=Coptis chinensis TaxID=261450 RepID=A0A835HZJ9_9MAGN|nr:hypothetical protein IFM89_024059 [Coptis chinensis]